MSYSVPLSKVTYTYTGEGLLLTSGTNTLTWDVSSSPQLLSDGSFDYVYAPNGRLVEAISSTAHYFAVDDGQGSARAYVATNGALDYATFTYGPWGKSTPSGSPNVGYQGTWIDPNSGFYLMGNRFYDTGTGQFITPDPANTLVNQPYGFAGFNGTLTKAVTTLSPLSLGDPTQAYNFAQDDPLNLTDVSGEGVPFTPDQDALVQLAKVAKNTGVSEADAETLLNWGQEYGMGCRGPEQHSSRGFGSSNHIHISPVNHIPVNP